MQGRPAGGTRGTHRTAPHNRHLHHRPEGSAACLSRGRPGLVGSRPRACGCGTVLSCQAEGRPNSHFDPGCCTRAAPHRTAPQELYRAAKKRFDEEPDFKVRAREAVTRLQSGAGVAMDCVGGGGGGGGDPLRTAACAKGCAPWRTQPLEVRRLCVTSNEREGGRGRQRPTALRRPEGEWMSSCWSTCACPQPHVPTHAPTPHGCAAAATKCKPASHVWV